MTSPRQFHPLEAGLTLFDVAALLSLTRRSKDTRIPFDILAARYLREPRTGTPYWIDERLFDDRDHLIAWRIISHPVMLHTDFEVTVEYSALVMLEGGEA